MERRRLRLRGARATVIVAALLLGSAVTVAEVRPAAASVRSQCLFVNNYWNSPQNSSYWYNTFAGDYYNDCTQDANHLYMHVHTVITCLSSGVTGTYDNTYDAPVVYLKARSNARDRIWTSIDGCSDHGSYGYSGHYYVDSYIGGHGDSAFSNYIYWTRYINGGSNGTRGLPSHHKR